MVPPLCGSVLDRAEKRYNGYCLQFCLGESCPPALILMPDTSLPPHIPLMPLKMLPQCWSPEIVSLSKSTCRATQEEMPENPGVSFNSTPTGFYSQKLWGIIFLALNPGLCCLMCGWHPLLPRYSSITYSPHMGLRLACSASLHLHPSVPSICLDEYGFFNSLVVGIQLDFLTFLSDVCCVV